MSNITQSTLEQLEKLACLNISESEEKEIASALESVLGMFEKMAEIDTKNVDHLSIQPKTSMDGPSIRNDQPSNYDFSEKLAVMSPEFNPKTSNIIVPIVIDKEN